ncbi:polysaccharide biosynthesis protein [Metabacillus halosaccharovorans]|uniref:polysaccharide biosynthesis protein n=1 Tax=Metabacillus halosaccharovorans TaxID=930124 RepID=UPI001C1F8D77|nr:polysaccharide biosynthesis protein [Metabacillus halosaccharovorans]MBU7591860.1 polysaccharide biosynthesis protein [Metabacillus halosaccharovorans]
MNNFVKGTLLLVIAAFFGECLEFVVNMILARELGEEGMGMYMSILPIIFFIVIIASLELPVSISKFIAEKHRETHYHMLKHTLTLTIIFSCLFTVFAAIVLPYLPIFQGYHPYVKWLFILLIPVIAFSSIARGYFMGVQHMGKIAVSNFLKKVVQLAILYWVYQSFHFNLEVALLIALATLIGSELLVCTYLVAMYFIEVQILSKEKKKFIRGSKVRRALFAVSFPTTGLRLFHSLTHAIQPFLVKGALIAAGFSTVMANEHYGMLAGVAMSIGFFPAFIGHSLMVMLIPNVSEAYANNETNKLIRLLQQSVMITMIYGTVSMVVMYVYAEPLTHLFFDSTAASIYLKLLWPYFLFHFFIIPMQAYLIGLGLVKEALFHTVWSHMISFGMMYVLGSMEVLQMKGVILGMNMGAVLLMLMHYVTICNKLGVSVYFLRKKLTI